MPVMSCKMCQLSPYFKQLLRCSNPKLVHLETRWCFKRNPQSFCCYCQKGKPTKRVSKKKKIAQNFIKKGTNPKPRKKQKLSILHTDSPTDWHITFGFNNNSTIPPETSVDTLQRPDIVIHSVSKKRIIWFENTVPLERNIIDAQLRKTRRYAKLKTALSLKGWSVEDFTIEVRALGSIATSFDFALR